MFRLDHEVSKWCSGLAQQGHLSSSQLEELRDHLYTEVEKQQASGVSEEDAFRLAIRKLGPIDELIHEYSKNQGIGRVLNIIANVRYGAQVLGVYLLALGCLMCYSTVNAYYAYYSGDFTPPNTLPFVLAFVVIATFGWCGFKGFQLLRGNVLSYGALAGLLTLVLIQVPIVGGLQSNGYEFSGGLQLAVLFGAVEQHLEFNPVADVHVNTGVTVSYFGVNVIALLAAAFIGSNMFDRRRGGKVDLASTTAPA